MKFIVKISSDEFGELVKKFGSKSKEELKASIKETYDIRHDFSIRVYNDGAYEFELIGEEGEEEWLD